MKRGNGEGSIYQRKDGRWMGSITTGRNENGKVVRKTVYGKTKQEVIKKMDSIKHELSIGTYAEPNNITVKNGLFIGLMHTKSEG